MDFLFPIIAHAQTTGGIKSLVLRVNDYVLNPLIKLGFAIALLIFLWGVVQYIRDRDAGRIWDASVFDDKGKATSRGAEQIVWGLIGLFIMVSTFGIMRLVVGLIGSNIQTP